MSEPLDQNELASVPDAVVHAPRRSRLPLIWLVPLVAALIGGWLAVRGILARGPTIQVTFEDADGVEAGKTKVRFKNVDVGIVKTITLASDLRTVVVSIDMAKFAAPLLVSDSRFWVVRPRLGATGVSGLGTLLSGPYIGLDMGRSRQRQHEFKALSEPPAVESNQSGTEFVLKSADLGSLSAGSPAYFRHIQVGQISSLKLDPDGHGVTLTVFVDAHYAKFVTEDTRFWHASGVDVALDAAGVRMQTESVATIMAGGIAFESPPGSTATTPSAGGAEFELAANRDQAMKTPDKVVEKYILYFDESLRGLAPGAVVDFRGVDIGEVVQLKVEYEAEHDKFRFPVLVNVYPERLRARYLTGTTRPQGDAHSLVSRMIEHGFRAQLRPASLLTGQLFVAVDFFPKAPKVVPQPQLTPMPLPTQAGNLQELQQTIVSVAQKIDRMPLEKIGHDVDTALVSLDRVLNNADGMVGKINTDILPQAKSALTEAQATLAGTAQALAPDAKLQTDLHNTLSGVGRAADSLRNLADYLDKHPESLLRGKPKDPE